jgi:hypothetical protein
MARAARDLEVSTTEEWHYLLELARSSRPEPPWYEVPHILRLMGSAEMTGSLEIREHEVYDLRSRRQLPE